MSIRIIDKPTVTSTKDSDKLFLNVDGALRQAEKSVLLQSVKDDIADVNNGIQATGTYLNLTDTIKGKAQLVDLVHNYFDGDVTKNTVINNDGSISANAGVDTTNTYVDVSYATNIQGIATVANSYFRVVFYDENKTYISRALQILTVGTVTSFTPTIPTNAKYMRMSYEDTITDIMLSTVNAPYVPYEGYEVKSAGNNNFKGVIEQGSCWGGTLDNSAIRISSDYTPIKQGEEYLVTYDLADRCFCVFYDTSKVFITQDSVMTSGKKTFKASADGYVSIILAYNNDRNITPNDGDFNLRVMPVEDTVFITNSTDTAYINTYDNVTNIYADTTLNVRYGNTPTVNDVVTSKGEISNLQYIDVKGEWCVLRDSLSGKCEVKASVYNLIDADTLYADFKQSDGTFKGSISSIVSVHRNFTANEIGKTLIAKVKIKQEATSIQARLSASINNVLTRDIATTTDWEELTITFTPTSTQDYLVISYGEAGIIEFTDFMLSEVVKPYVPYELSIKSVGENLIPYPYLLTSETTQGVSITVNDDGTINFSGTITGGIYAFLTKTLSLKAGTYTLSGTANGSSLTTYRLYAVVNGNYHNDLGNGVTFVLDNDTSGIQIGIVISNSGATINATFKPMLNTGTTPLPYKPYVSSTATLSTNTPTAYLDTFEGLTQVYSEYDVPLKVRYGNSPVTNDILSNKGNIAYLLSQLNA